METTEERDQVLVVEEEEEEEEGSSLESILRWILSWLRCVCPRLPPLPSLEFARTVS